MACYNDPINNTRIWHVRDGGDDQNAGTCSAPLATIGQALERVRKTSAPDIRRQVIEVTGLQVTDTETLDIHLPNRPYRNGVDFARAGTGGADNGREDLWDGPVEIIADPTLHTTVTVTGTTPDATTGMVELTVSDTLTVDELKGMFLWKGPFEQGQVHSNTANTILIASYVTVWSGSFGVYKQSCLIDQPLTIAGGSPLVFNGIKLAGDIYVYCDHIPTFTRCYLDALDLAVFEAPIAYLYDCYVNAGYIRADGSALYASGTVLQGTQFPNTAYAGRGRGLHQFDYDVFDGCQSVGGLTSTTAKLTVQNCLIRNAVTHGIQLQSPQASLVKNTRVENSTSSGILIPGGGGLHTIQAVSGTGNGGHGIQLQAGAQSKLAGTSTLTGTGGDLKLGDKTATWASFNALAANQSLNDNDQVYPQFCRVTK